MGYVFPQAGQANSAASGLVSVRGWLQAGHWKNPSSALFPADFLEILLEKTLGESCHQFPVY
jgi:hypothetical protein